MGVIKETYELFRNRFYSPVTTKKSLKDVELLGYDRKIYHLKKDVKYRVVIFSC